MPRSAAQLTLTPFVLQGAADSSDDGSGYLRIGGVVINVDGRGNISGMRRGNSRQQALPPPALDLSGEGDSDTGADSSNPSNEVDIEDAIDDYLNNVEASSGDDGLDGEGSKEGGDSDGGVHWSRAQHFEMLRRFGGVEIGDEGAVEDIIGRGETSSSEEEEEWSDDGASDGDHVGSSASSFSSDGEEQMILDADIMHQAALGLGLHPSVDSGELLAAGGSGDSDGVLTEDIWANLSLELRYPVQARPAAPPTAAYYDTQQGPKDKRRHRPGVKGAKGGKLAPGEKAKLRKEGIEARRASRAASRGFDLASVNKALQDFVEAHLDMQAFPPMAKQECRQVQKLAALYGCRAGAQGSGKKRSVIIAMTQHTRLPTGDALLQVGRMLALHANAELRAQGMVAGPSGNVPKHGQAGGRWAGVRQAGNSSGKKGKRKGSHGLSPWEGGAADPDNRVFFSWKGEFSKGKSRVKTKTSIKPVAFVSRGVICPDEDHRQVLLPRPSGDAELMEEEDASPTAAAAPALPAVLPVFEDRGGGSDNDTDVRSALGGRDLLSEAQSVPIVHRGADAAEGITNPGRLLGLGMALGIGSEIFGSAGVAASPGDDAADLSMLQPKQSKAAHRRKEKQRRAARGRPAGEGSSGQAMDSPTGAMDLPGDGGLVTQRSFERQVAVSGDYADFERHTTGIGSRLLAKWGFGGQGAGLGRDGSGVAEPVVASRRAKGLGLGAER